MATLGQSITEFTVPTAGSGPYGIGAGPDGALWFAERSGNKIGRITTSGAFSEFPVPTPNSQPIPIRAGPDGNLWFGEATGNKIGRVTTSGAISEFPIPTNGADPLGVAAGPDGNVWFVEFFASKIGRITPTGTITEFATGTGGQPDDLALGPGGNLWFSEQNDKIGRITPTGTITEFPTAAGSTPLSIAAGPDGALWFTEINGNKIGRITTSGVITEYAIPTAGSRPTGIAAGPDGALWFTEFGGNKIGRITISGVITEYAIPTAGSAPYGIAAGPDGALWFTESTGNKIGRITACVPPTAVASAAASAICAGSSTTLTGSGGVTCSWSPSTGLSNANACTTTASPSATTTYRLTVTAAGGCASTNNSSVTITVNAVPGPPPITAPAAASAGQVGLAASAPAHSGSLYTWNISNGTITAGQGTSSITFTAGVAGSLVLDLVETSSAACASPHSSFTVTISQTVVAPVARFTAPATAAVNAAVAFLDTSTNNPTSWSWSFGDGGTASAQNPTHVYTTPNTYNVQLTAANAAGTSAFTRAITISPTSTPPVVSFCAPPSVDVNTAVQFTDTSDTSTGKPTSWSWSFGDGAIASVQNPTHTYTAPNTYTVRLTASNAAGSSTSTGILTVTPPTAAAPVASFCAPASETVNQAIHFTDTSANHPTAWTWSFGDGGTSNVQNPTHVYTTSTTGNATQREANSGGYNVTLTAANTAGSSAVGALVTITHPVPPAADFTVSPAPPGAGQIVRFTDSSTGGPTSWSWDFGDGSSSTAQNPTKAYAAAGSYTVSLAISNSAGTSSKSQAVTVTSCVANATTLCLNNGRFRVSADWVTQTQAGHGTGIQLTDDTGYFWFFNSSNIELALKVLDGRTINGNFWVFYGALSNVQYTITVTDTLTGAVRTYVNPSGNLASVADTTAFPSGGSVATTSAEDAELAYAQYAALTSPEISQEASEMAPGATAACTPGGQTLCLGAARFRLQVTWQVPSQGRSGVGQAVLQTDDTGYFWFFSSNNVELVIKVLDGRTINGKFWVFYGALSNVQYTITVTDTQTGTVRTYVNPSGTLASIADTSAF